MLNNTIVILGPTCTGKTSLAIKLCKLFNGAIISADSRQVVRHMDIGTGKVPVGEYSPRHREAEGRGDLGLLRSHTLARNDKTSSRDDGWNVDGVDIFGYDLVNPDEYFSAYDFVKYCQEIFPRVRRDATARHSAEGGIFLVGGTGFYIDAVTGRISLEGVGPDMKLRKSLENLSTEELAGKLYRLDEPAYKTIDTKNPVRLVRAIEKATQADDGNACLPTRLLRPAKAGLAMTIPKPVYLGLTADREVLYSRADRWVDTIFTEKLFEEVKTLQERFPKSHRLNGLIYKSATDYLNGLTVLEDAKQKAKFAMHAYIRRQQTWFKRNNEIKWLDISDKNFDSKASSIVKSLVNGESSVDG